MLGATQLWHVDAIVGAQAVSHMAEYIAVQIAGLMYSDNAGPIYSAIPTSCRNERRLLTNTLLLVVGDRAFMHCMQMPESG